MRLVAFRLNAVELAPLNEQLLSNLALTSARDVEQLVLATALVDLCVE
jgi:hypothetical protein